MMFSVKESPKVVSSPKFQTLWGQFCCCVSPPFSNNENALEDLLQLTINNIGPKLSKRFRILCSLLHKFMAYTVHDGMVTGRLLQENETQMITNITRCDNKKQIWDTDFGFTLTNIIFAKWSHVLSLNNCLQFQCSDRNDLSMTFCATEVKTKLKQNSGKTKRGEHTT